MTRPTEKQLAELVKALETIAGEFPPNYARRGDPAAMLAVVRHIAAEALRAYRSAQQAEVGAAGDLPPLPEPDTKQSLTYDLIRYVPGWPASYITTYARTYGQQCYEAGRQQGMEQARAEALTRIADSTERMERGVANLSNPDTSDCDPGLLAYAKSTLPAASSAQEPGWVMVPVELTPEMIDAAGLHDCVNTGSLRGAWRDMLAAAPARLAGAAQGEAVAWIDPADFETLEEDGWCVVHASACDPGADHNASVPLYTHPQAQVERRPLSDEQIDRIYDRDEFDEMDGTGAVLRAYARAIEAAHGIGIPTASTASDEGSV